MTTTEPTPGGSWEHGYADFDHGPAAPANTPPAQPSITGHFQTGQPPPQPRADDDGVPTFGRRDTSAPVKRIPFNLTAYRGDEEVVEPLIARADVDLSSVFGLGRSGATMANQIATMRSLLMRTLVDDDGISVRATVQAVVPRPGAEDDDDLIPVDELPDGADYNLSDVEHLTPEVRDRDGNLLVEEELHDTAGDAAAHMRARGSSLRRFAAVMDDDSLWLEQTALEEIIDYLMTQAADRPTKRSSGPSRSRRRKGR